MSSKALLFLATLFLAACGGATYTPPAQVIYVTVPVPVGIGPAELQRASDSATNTAVAVAAQLTQDARGAALATAVEQNARETSTAMRQSTEMALAGKQTESALSLTQGAGLAAATNAAAVHTAEADQTAAAAPATAAALRVAVAATGTQLARQAETAVRRQSLDDQIAAAWRWVAVVVGGLAGLGIAGALTFGVSDILSARADLARAAARRAEAEAAQLWVMQYGSRLFQLRGNNVWEEMQQPQIAAPAPPPELEPVATNIHEVPVRTKSEITGTIPVGVEETPERLKVMHLLLQAAAVAGPGSAVIPSAPAMGMHPQEWQDAVDLLKANSDHAAYVMTSPGRPKAGALGRTRLVQPAYKTVGQLLDGVKRGDALPRPAPPTPMPTPGNVQNVTAE